jgi:hypothetical protein
MNNLLFTVVVSWQTRNWRRSRQAENWCRDFGLRPLHKKLYIGTLYRDERASLDSKLRALFCGKTDFYYSFSMCASCAKDANIGHEALQAIADKPAYEIVRIGK